MTDDAQPQPFRLVWVDLAEETRNLPPTDNETTPEYKAWWVEEKRRTLEARRADLDAAVRQLVESLVKKLAEARQRQALPR